MLAIISSLCIPSNSFYKIPFYFMCGLIILCVLFVIEYFVYSYKHFKLMCDINKNQFTVTTDKLVSCEEKHRFDLNYDFFKSSRLNLRLNRAYRLYFSVYGEYLIPRKKNHRWSDMHCMFDKDVYNYSVADDEFYLAVVGNKKIVLAYNAKLFEFKD